MVTTEQYDTIVVGSGGVGCWAAKELSERGLNTLVLDAGPHLDPNSDFPLPDRYSFGRIALLGRMKAIATGQHVQARGVCFSSFNRHLYVNDRKNPYTHPKDKPFIWLRGRQVGGRMFVWGRVAVRLSDYQFKAASRDGWGIDWPICYEDIAPYYDHVESYHGLVGSKENIPHLPDGLYTASKPMTPEELEFKAYVENEWPGIKVISPRQFPFDDARTPKPLRAAFETGNMTLRPNSVVRRLTIDPNTGKATGVEIIDRLTKKLITVRGRTVMLCASAFESTRLLFNSACDKHPEGVGNSTGILGRYLLDHCGHGIWGFLGRDKSAKDEGLFIADKSDPYDVGATTGFYIPRFRNLEEKHPDFLRGYSIQGAIARNSDPTRGPLWSMKVFGECLPRESNRLTINRKRKDAWGIPIIKVDFQFSDNEHKMLEDGLHMAREMATGAGYKLRREEGLGGRVMGKLLDINMLPGAAIHEVGGARMGTDPSHSVLNANNQCWDAENLFVTDGACYVSTGVQNTTLTAQALTVRACKFIADNINKGVF
jgi:choline dehydrogenase-like flavoprotein